MAAGNELSGSPREHGCAEGKAECPLVTATIANYNGRALLEVLLPSLARQSYERLEIVVVDDASTDDSVEYLAESWPSVKVIAPPEKVGVTAALNLCAQAGDGELVFMLNNDIELDPSCLQELVDALAERRDAGVATAKLRDYTRRELLDGTGDVYSWGGFAYRRGQGEEDRGQYDDAREVFGACAAAALYRRDAFERVGPYDERFFALCEDYDWAFRAQLVGLRCVFAPRAIAYHVGSASLGPRLSKFTLYHNWRNGIWTVVKNYPRGALLRHAPDLLLGQMAMLLIATRRRCLDTLAKAWLDALRGIGPVLRERRRIQADRVAGWRELEPLIESCFRTTSRWGIAEVRQLMRRGR